MSCFIKAIIEYYKREHGYDPSDPVAKRRAARPSISMDELLKKYPAMKLDPPWTDEPDDQPKKPDHH